MKEFKAEFFPPLDIGGNVKDELFANMTPLKECVSGREPNKSTFIRVLNDGVNLYFVFKVIDDNINPVRTKYNSKIYNEEVVEVFVSGADIRKYLEFEVSPNNTRFCGKVRNSLKGRRKLKLIGKCIFDSKVVTDKDGYFVIIKAAKKAIADKLNIKGLESCYFNIYRIDRPNEAEWELSALSPTGKENFHCPKSFIRLII